MILMQIFFADFAYSSHPYFCIYVHVWVCQYVIIIIIVIIITDIYIARRMKCQS